MLRPCGIKGQKRKKREERYDKEEDEVEAEEQSIEKAKRAMVEEKEMAMETSGKEEEELEGQTHEMAGIPIVPSDLKTKKPGLIFVLERASLEVAKVGKALLSILDSPVNKAGRLRAVYVKTDKGVLFEVKPHVRIPRTYKRFAGIMLQLLQKLSITAVGKREKLLRVIKNPVTQYLPVNSRKIGFSYSSEKLVKMNKYVAAVSDDVDIVFVVGAMAHGKIDCDYIDDFIAISGYPLSAAWCISRICEAVADKWDVL
ncbi:ribosomal RNA small subunit methyltransferase NEP1-like isoform X5 [Hevea brasiliensis]|uniref:ribosomal RNA small subunit methyltransferase NEP1-like isoform X5 n=1 Tax=Hevea brasiliensis TaxID=3981 RepID=UPI0025EFA167|nr:ribosomal RNA small subunit methyltransferase NEP1-like isoform X5 [Hevea brasiliensis]